MDSLRSFNYWTSFLITEHRLKLLEVFVFKERRKANEVLSFTNSVRTVVTRKRYDTGDRDKKRHHSEADTLLLEYINDRQIQEAYDNISKWYA